MLCDIDVQDESERFKEEMEQLRRELQGRKSPVNGVEEKKAEVPAQRKKLSLRDAVGTLKKRRQNVLQASMHRSISMYFLTDPAIVEDKGSCRGGGA